MIDQSTKRDLKAELLSFLEGAEYYYIKSTNIVDKISFNGRNFYSKYKRVDKKPNSIVLNQHLKREIKVALPLKENQIFIRYFGKESDKFLFLLNRLIRESQKEIFLYQKDKEIDILIVLNSNSSYKIKRLISSKLREFLEIEWKILPDKTLPESYNIFPLPCKIY